MGMDIYISDMEHEKCRKVMGAFSELYEIENTVVADVGRYGFVVLKYYKPPHGFEECATYTESRSLFDDLWEEWLNTQIYLLAKGTPLMEKGYDGVFESLPEDKRNELMEQKKVFAEKAGLS